MRAHNTQKPMKNPRQSSFGGKDASPIYAKTHDASPVEAKMRLKKRPAAPRPNPYYMFHHRQILDDEDDDASRTHIVFGCVRALYAVLFGCEGLVVEVAATEA